MDKLEKRRPRPQLTYEVRRDIGPHGSQIPETLEGQIIRFADQIAYINHDIDDASAPASSGQATFPGPSPRLGRTARRTHRHWCATLSNAAEVRSGSLRRPRAMQKLRSFMLSAFTATRRQRARVQARRCFWLCSSFTSGIRTSSGGFSQRMEREGRAHGLRLYRGHDGQFTREKYAVFYPSGWAKK